MKACRTVGMLCVLAGLTSAAQAAGIPETWVETQAGTPTYDLVVTNVKWEADGGTGGARGMGVFIYRDAKRVHSCPSGETAGAGRSTLARAPTGPGVPIATREKENP